MSDSTTAIPWDRPNTFTPAIPWDRPKHATPFDDVRHAMLQLRERYGCKPSVLLLHPATIVRIAKTKQFAAVSALFFQNFRPFDFIGIDVVNESTDVQYLALLIGSILQLNVLTIEAHREDEATLIDTTAPASIWIQEKVIRIIGLSSLKHAGNDRPSRLPYASPPSSQ